MLTIPEQIDRNNRALRRRRRLDAAHRTLSVTAAVLIVAFAALALAHTVTTALVAQALAGTGG